MATRPTRRKTSPLPVAPDSPSTPADPFTLKLSADALATHEHRLCALWEHAKGSLEPFHRRLTEWKELYEGLREPTWKPWAEASAVFFPIPALIADTAASRIEQTFFQQREIVTVETSMKDSAYSEAAGRNLRDDLAAMRRTVDNLVMNVKYLDARKLMSDLCFDITVAGESFFRLTHDRLVSPRRRVIGPDGVPTIEINFVELDKIAAKRMPPELSVWEENNEEIAMFGYSFRLSMPRLQQLATAQGWSRDKLNTILAHPDPMPPDEHARLEEIGHRSPITSDIQIIKPDGTPVAVSPLAVYTLREVYLACTDVDGDGVIEDTTSTWHPASQTVARVALWAAAHNHFPVRRFCYRRRPGHVAARGTIEPIAPIAAGVNTIVNQTIDAQSIRNCPTIAGPEDSEAQDLLEKGWKPGMYVPESSPQAVRPMEFGQTGNTVVSMGIIDKLIEMSFRINHLGPAQFGEVGVAQRVPTDLGQSIMSEGVSMLDNIVSNVRHEMTSLINDYYAMLWQFQRDTVAQASTSDDMQAIQSLIDTIGLPGLNLSINITSSQHSRELERQNLAAISVRLSELAQQVIQGVGLVSGSPDPTTGQVMPAPAPLRSAVIKWTRALQNANRQLLESFPNITDATQYVPDVATDLETAEAAAVGQPQPIAPTGPVPEAPGLGALLPFGAPGG